VILPQTIPSISHPRYATVWLSDFDPRLTGHQKVKYILENNIDEANLCLNFVEEEYDKVRTIVVFIFASAVVNAFKGWQVTPM